MNGEHLGKRWKMFLSLAEADKPGSVTDGYPVNGANYAIRRRVLLDIGGFSEKLGRVGGCLISGDESYVTKSVLDAGLGAGFVCVLPLVSCAGSHCGGVRRRLRRLVTGSD